MARHDPPEDKALRGPPADKTSALAAGRQRWICPRCGAPNAPVRATCGACGLKRPQPPREPVPA